MPQQLTDAQDFPHDFHLPRGLCPGLPWAPPTAAGSPDPRLASQLLRQAVVEDINHQGRQEGEAAATPGQALDEEILRTSSNHCPHAGSLCNPSGGGEGLPLPRAPGRKRGPQARAELRQCDASGPLSLAAALLSCAGSQAHTSARMALPPASVALACPCLRTSGPAGTQA